jgi:hypothetical protein
MRLTGARVGMLAVILQWIVFWPLFTHPAVARLLPNWPLLLGYGVLFAAAGVVAARRGRRWSAPLLAGASALVGSVCMCLVGILTGEFLALGLGPALVLGYLVWMLGLGVSCGIAGLVLVLARDRFDRDARAT